MPSSHTVYPIAAVPVNPVSGTNVMLPPASVTVPWVSGPAVTAVTVNDWKRSSNGPASSLVTNVAAGTTTSAPARAVTESGCGTGASLTGVTLIVTVAGATGPCRRSP